MEARMISSCTAPAHREPVFRRVIESLGIPTVCVGRDGRILEWNCGAEALLGFSRREIVGRPIWEIVPGHERDRSAEMLRRVLGGEQIERLETERLHRDGSAIPLSLAVGPLFGEDGEVAGVIGSLQDLRPDRAAEQALRQSEAAFRALVEKSPEPIFVHRGGTVIYANPALLSMTGYSREQLLGTSILDLLVHADERAVVLRRIRESADSDRPLPPLEARVKRRDGSVRVAETVAVRIDYHGEPATLVIGRDVTERRQLQSRLMISDRMVSIGTLAAGIAHEINNPLAWVLGNLEALEEEIRSIAGASPSSRLRELDARVGEARAGVERIARIVRGLRVFSRADEERRASLDLHPVLELAVNMSQNELRHRARLIRAYGQAPRVEADEARLCQVFINLLVNAAQSISEGAAEQNEIRIASFTDAQGRAVVEVRDSGSGIPRELKDRIFDPFFTTKPVGVGTGLGLSICHGIVTSLGGEILVESEPGRGSLFRVTLPPARGRELPPPARAAEPAPRRARILVVDDDARIAAIVGRMLPDHEVTVLDDGAVALRRILAEPFDLILCDLMMPELTGMDLYERAAADRPELAERFVFVTGGAFTPRARSFLESVPCPRIEKPFRAEDLRALVHPLLRPEAQNRSGKPDAVVA